MRTALCPCGNPNTYETCCERIHANHSKADHPETLMRSRYSAYVLGLTDFIINTYHPSCKAEKLRGSIEQAPPCEWKKLEVLSSSIDANNNSGYVEFKAHFIEQGLIACLHEKSRFLREEIEGKSLWFYIDGVYPTPEKHGRNDPCPCGSGKKYKRCCG